ncbi:hypothetical protein RLEG12_24505 [Rhizobium leguminosarum bv. trifolii CB782]|nr:hypothetical protein RLEG12_24505 [Rhizobium leguminosarum bv. trifolii CB782]
MVNKSGLLPHIEQLGNRGAAIGYQFAVFALLAVDKRPAARSTGSAIVNY